MKMIQTAYEWAQVEFGAVNLGDRRRTKRTVEVARALAESPGGTLPGPLPDWPDLKSAYRLLENNAVTFEKFKQPHWERSLQACCARGEFLLIEDSPLLDFTERWAVRGLGRVGNDGGRGFYAHTTLALRVEGWTAAHAPVTNMLGLFDQQVWTRDDEPKKGREKKRARLERPRESQRWLKALDRTGGPPPGARWTFVADREADIAEVFIKAREHGADFVVRPTRPGAVEAEEGNLFDAAARAPLKGSYEINWRARAGQAARSATLQVRARAIAVRGPWRPSGNLPAQNVQVVEVREVGAPQGVEPLVWVLLTSWPCETLQQCIRIVEAYSARWLIEEYHKALKTGTGLEESQLESAHGLQALLGILALVAVRLLALKLAARAQPDALVEMNALDEEMWAVLEAKFSRPKEGWTYRSTLVAIARLGGFLARKGDGDPGWLTLWRGWQRLVRLAEGYALRRRCG